MTRSLTVGERALAAGVFGDALAADPVRLIGSPWPFDRAFVPGTLAGRQWIVWPRRGLPADIAVAPLAAQATLIHELVHVWQAQTGVNLLFGKLRAGDGPAAYAYPATRNCRWDALNIEQQAMVVEHRFRRSRGEATPGDDAFHARVCPFPAAGRPRTETQRFDPRACTNPPIP
ncbi:hypothetical protein BH09PSE1_BH09PSE1_30110 [soil metagenome]